MIVLILLPVILLSGCNFKTEEITTLLISKPSTQPSPQATTTDAHRGANAEFIHEVFKAVLDRDVVSEEEFSKYMNILDQGGHLDGIYNGLIYSPEYRLKEKGVASISALKLFAEILAQLTLDQKYDSLKLSKTERPDVPSSEEEPAPTPNEAERKELQEKFENEYLSKPSAVLKKRLGEETLKVIDLKREYKEKFASWYGKFTVWLNKKGADFGIAARNRTDEYFHYQWALNADEDRIKWECLNRIHVLMNKNEK